MGDIRSRMVSHPLMAHTVTSSFIAMLALTPTPALVPIIALISVIRLSSWAFVHRPGGFLFAVVQLLAISLAAGVAQLTPSLEALSTPTISLVVLSVISIATSAIALLAAFAACYVERIVSSQWATITIFPALWASAWGSISYVSSVGQLATWSPVVGLGPYWWIRQYLGQWGVNWIAAAWAGILSTLLGNWIVGTGETSHREDEPIISFLDDPEHGNEGTSIPRSGSSQSTSRSKETLAGLLILLMIPSYFFSSIPLPPFSDNTTPFTVGCVLPIPKYSGQRSGLPTLDDYIHDSRTLQASANIVIWPENAVRFASPAEKEDTFRELQLSKNMNKGKYWGISFEEYIPADLKGGVYKKGMKRNGFALLGSSGPPVLEYYKRHLVPIAESFPLVPGSEDPEMFTVELSAPKNYNKTDWAPAPKYTRPIPITTSICLDLASPSSFDHLESRPSLILAPANTWHIGVGLAMWEQAKARAEETGSTVVWCDGGDGGVSGVAGGGYDEFVQVGQGSWYKTIGVPYPFNEERTTFARLGQYGAFMTVWAIVGVGYAVEGFLKRDDPQAGNLVGGRSLLKISQLVSFLRSFGRGSKVQAGEERPLLE
ncbi:unnamed protein product [Somion occarium]|uniref:Apolipoprotein N-acyltransferase n=1 Tax=Somion occarium TaxID=3059160 RepID=A0ABP1CHM4_9APHY